MSKLKKQKVNDNKKEEDNENSWDCSACSLSNPDSMPYCTVCETKKGDPLSNSVLPQKRSDKPNKKLDEPPKSDKPSKKLDKPSKKLDKPSKKLDKPSKKVDTPKKETDKPKQELDEPQIERSLKNAQPRVSPPIQDETDKKIALPLEDENKKRIKTLERKLAEQTVVNEQLGLLIKDLKVDADKKLFEMQKREADLIQSIQVRDAKYVALQLRIKQLKQTFENL